MKHDAEPAGEPRPAPTDETVGGAGAGAGDRPELDAEALLAFFRSAPPEVRAWIREQTARDESADDGPAETHGDAGSADSDAGVDGTGIADVDDADLDDDLNADIDDDPDDDLDDDDDMFVRSRPKAPRSAATGVAPDHPPARRTSPFLRGAIVVAVVAGICGGIWYAGRAPADAADSAAQSTAQDAVTVQAQIESLSRAVEQDPRNVEARLSLGVILFDQLGDYESAKEQFEAVLEIDPENIIALYNMGLYHRYVEPPDLDAGRAAWQKVLDLDPDSDVGQLVASHMDRVMTDAESADGSTPTADPTPTDGG